MSILCALQQAILQMNSINVGLNSHKALTRRSYFTLNIFVQARGCYRSQSSNSTFISNSTSERGTTRQCFIFSIRFKQYKIVFRVIDVLLSTVQFFCQDNQKVEGCLFLSAQPSFSTYSFISFLLQSKGSALQLQYFIKVGASPGVSTMTSCNGAPPRTIISLTHRGAALQQHETGSIKGFRNNLYVFCVFVYYDRMWQ